MNELLLYTLTSALFFLVLTAGAVFMKAAGVTDKTAKALPFWVFALMLLQYLFSAIGLMEAGPVVLLVLSVLLWVVSAVLGIRSKRCPPDLGFFLFAGVYAVLCYGNYGRCAQFSDDLLHWAAVVKVMCEQGLMSCSAAANLSHASYPPAMAMLQYLPQRYMCLVGSTTLFSEQYLYLAYEAAVATVPFYMAAKQPGTRKRPVQVLCIALFTLAMFCFAPRLLRFIMIDGYMGLVFALGAILLLENVSGRRGTLAFALLVAALALLKNTGILYAALLVLSALIAARNEKKTLALAGAASAAVAYGSWKLLYSLGGASSKFDLNLSTVLTDKGALLRENLLRYLKTTCTTGLHASETLCPAIFLPVFALLCALAVYVVRGYKKSRRCVTVVTVLLAAALLLYIAMPFAYTYIFPASEAMRSWDRYLAMPLSAALMLLTYALAGLRPEESRSGRILLAVSFAALFCFFPYKEPLRFLTRHEAKQSSAFHRAFDGIESVVSALPADSKLLVCEEEGANGNEKQALRYLLLPRTVEFLDAGGKGHYMLKTGAATEAEALLTYMRQNGFTHLYVYTAGDHFPDELLPAFESGTICDKTLYVPDGSVLKPAA